MPFVTMERHLTPWVDVKELLPVGTVKTFTIEEVVPVEKNYGKGKDGEDKIVKRLSVSFTESGKSRRFDTPTPAETDYVITAFCNGKIADNGDWYFNTDDAVGKEMSLFAEEVTNDAGEVKHYIKIVGQP
jgi:hypothetical protein